MLTVISKIKKGSDQGIQLIISKNDFENFKEYKNIGQNGKAVEKEFCAEFIQDGKLSYITGKYPEEGEGEGEIIMYINSVNGKNQGMQEELGLDQVGVLNKLCQSAFLVQLNFQSAGKEDIKLRHS